MTERATWPKLPFTPFTAGEAWDAAGFDTDVFTRPSPD
jgi:hypothetical protein